MKKYRKKATPEQNGWKYFAINLDLVDHKIVRKQMDLLCECTGKTKKQLFIEMLDERINKEIKGIKMNNDRKVFYCVQCNEPCKTDEINEDMVCIDCQDLFCELGDTDE